MVSWSPMGPYWVFELRCHPDRHRGAQKRLARTCWRDRLEIHAISPAEMIHVGQPFRGLEPVCSRLRRWHRARLLSSARGKPLYGLSKAQTAEKRLKRPLESHFGSMPWSAAREAGGGAIPSSVFRQRARSSLTAQRYRVYATAQRQGRGAEGQEEGAEAQEEVQPLRPESW